MEKEEAVLQIVLEYFEQLCDAQDYSVSAVEFHVLLIGAVPGGRIC